MILTFSTPLLNNFVENSVSKVENFTIYNAEKESNCGFSAVTDILDRVFHMGK